MKSIKAIYCDNEGCIIPGKGIAFPVMKLHHLREVIRGISGVSFALATGRPIPYVEAMIQLLDILDCKLPSVCEGGGVLYWPSSDTSEILSPLEIPNTLLENLTPDSFRIEPGKSTCLSLYPNPPFSVQSLYDEVVASPDAFSFSISTSSAAVDITPPGIDKGAAILAVSNQCKISPSEMLCIGDSNNDIPLLELAGHSACPANATSEVKKMVDYVAKEQSTEGVIEILNHFKTAF